MKNRANRKAIAMIELIFSMVIMAIVLLGAPMLISQSVKSSFVGLQQESINTLSSHLNLVITKEWDEANANTQLGTTILRVDGGDLGLDISANNRYRTGTFSPSQRTFVISSGGNNVLASLPDTFGNGNDIGVLNDIDDYDEEITRVSVFNEDESSSDYVDTTIEITTLVEYGSDIATVGTYGTSPTLVFDNPFNTIPNNSTNIKLISVQLLSNSGVSELAKDIRFSAFSCNIGNFSLSRRSI